MLNFKRGTKGPAPSASSGQALSRANGPALSRANGFTLVEIMIVLAVLAVLAAVVIPNVAGFLGRGKERAFSRDRDILQAAVDVWRTDVGTRAGNLWPTLGSTPGTDGIGAIANCTDVAADGIDVGTIGSDCPIIKLSLLAPTYVKGTNVVKSFAYTTGTATGATNTVVGSYVWYIDGDGLVQARRWTPADSSDTDVDTGELAGTDGFVANVYP